MALVRWDPFREMAGFGERMNRMFGEFSREPASTTSWSPAVDIVENGEELILKAELPGMKKENITVHVEDNVLTLRGERKFEKETKEENYHRVEREYGSFVRSFALPSNVDESRIRAEYKDGLLTLSLPKLAASKPKEIKIATA